MEIFQKYTILAFPKCLKGKKKNTQAPVLLDINKNYTKLEVLMVNKLGKKWVENYIGFLPSDFSELI